MLRTPRSNDVHAFPHGGLRASMLIVAIALAGGARAQGFSSTQISSGVAANIPSIALAVNTANGTCYSAYTLGGGLEVFYATKPSGGSWTEEDAAVSAEEVAMTTTQFSHGNVVPHLALLGFFKSPNLSGNIMWATRSTGGIWTYEVVDPGLDQYCFSPSITLNIANVPHIAYWGYSSDGISRLRLATRLGPNNWQIDVVDSTYGSFDDVTVRMWDVPEVLTYGRLQNGASTWEFIYARRSGSTWVTEQIEPTASNPQNGAMTLPANGIAEVAYWSNDGLNYAYRPGANNWVRTKLRPALSNNFDRSISIIHDPSNRPQIAYFSEGGDSLRYASQTSSTQWDYQRVAQVNGFFGPISIGLHATSPQKPKIAYVAYDGAGIPRYYLAEGTQSFNGNQLTEPAGDEVTPVKRAGIAVAGGLVVTAGRVALTISQDAAGPVAISMLDATGRVVAVREPEWLGAGRHEVVWDVGSPPSGVYFMLLRTGSGARASARLVIAH